MIPLLRHFFRDLFYSEAKARVLLRAFLGWLVTALTVVTASATGADGGLSFDLLKTWTWEAWAGRFLVAGLGGVMLAIKSRNDEQTAAVVEKVQAKRVDEAAK